VQTVPHRCRRSAAHAVVVGALLVNAAPALGTDVPATSNVYGAGHVSAPAPGGGGGGTLPVLIPVPAGAVSLSVTNVSGTVRYRSGLPLNDADGVTSTCVDRPDYDGLAGPRNLPRGRHVTAVFLDDTEPGDPPPAGLDHNAMFDFTSIAPALRQMFFVGDGLTGTGTGDTQVFEVPAGATRLYFGFIDSNACGDPPGWYADNSGVITLTVVFESACAADITTQGAGVGDPGYGVPDGLVTAADLNYFVNAYVAGDTAIADITTQGAGVGDPNYGVPDGAVTAADLQYYVNLWVVGCP